MKAVALYRYPVKGMSCEALNTVALGAGAAMPFDRAYAIENGLGPFDAGRPAHLPKVHFLMLMRNEQLASLQCRFEEANQTLTIARDGEEMARGDLRTTDGRAAIEDYLAAYLPANALRGRPRIVSAPGHSFSDISEKCLHLINLESVRSLQTIMGYPIDPRRFRSNLIIDGAPAWSEFDWVGRRLSAGSATLDVFKRTERCAATNVDPWSGARDLRIPSLLSRTLGHTDFGVYARVLKGGSITAGDPVSLAAA